MDIYTFLESKGIQFERHDHPAVFTVEEAEKHVPPLAGVKIKNLFLCDNKGHRHFLVVAEARKSVDLKSLARLVEVKNLRFGSPERLKRILGIPPGAVTPLALCNDSSNQVVLIVDRTVYEAEAVQCHPLVNTATLLIPGEGLRRFFRATGHEPLVMDIPGRV